MNYPKLCLTVFLAFVTSIESIGQSTANFLLPNNIIYLVTLNESKGVYKVEYKKADTLLGSQEFVDFSFPYFYEFMLKIYATETGLAHSDSISTLDKDKIRAKAAELHMKLITGLYNSAKAGQEIATIQLKKDIPLTKTLFVPKSDRTKGVLTPAGGVITDQNGKEYNASALFYPEKTWPFRWTSQCTRKRAISTNEKFQADECRLVFEDGFIKRVVVTGDYENETLMFSNKYSIGITTRLNVGRLKNMVLFDGLRNDTQASIRLGDVIDYKRIVNSRTNDYSPADTVVVLTPQVDEVTVSKLKRHKLFRMNIFSDIIGVNEDNPNGLVQFEIEKRININTNRRFNRVPTAMFAFMTPYFQWSKIEENNRSLGVSTFSEDSSPTANYVSPLELYRHSILDAGIKLNVVDIEWPAIDFQINGTGSITFSQVTDTLLSDLGDPISIDERVNSITSGVEVAFIFSPESAWGFKISSNAFYYENFNSNLTYRSLNGSEAQRDLTSPERWLNDFNLLATFRTGQDNDSRLFARIGFIHEMNNFDNNFSEVQIGYSVYLKSSK
jgi:hypothetical protein